MDGAVRATAQQPNTSPNNNGTCLVAGALLPQATTMPREQIHSGAHGFRAFGTKPQHSCRPLINLQALGSCLVEQIQTNLRGATVCTAYGAPAPRCFCNDKREDQLCLNLAARHCSWTTGAPGLCLWELVYSQSAVDHGCSCPTFSGSSQRL